MAVVLKETKVVLVVVAVLYLLVVLQIVVTEMQAVMEH